MPRITVAYRRAGEPIRLIGVETANHDSRLVVASTYDIIDMLSHQLSARRRITNRDTTRCMLDFESNKPLIVTSACKSGR